MNNGAFGENFPYSNFHDLNMDWIIKIAKDFLDQYTHIQEIIENGETALTETIENGIAELTQKGEELDQALTALYETHSGELNTQTLNALSQLQTALNTAIAQFNSSADIKAEQTIASIPSDYSSLATSVHNLEIMYQNFYKELSFTGEITDHFISYYGNIQQTEGFNYVPQITLKAHQTIHFTARGYNTNVAMIAEYNGAGVNYTPLVLSTASEVIEYTYTAPYDMIIGISYNSSFTHSGYIELDWSDFASNEAIKKYLEKQIDMTQYVWGQYINTSGVPVTGANDFSYIPQIPLLAHQTIELECAGSGTVVSMIARFNGTGNNYTPLVLSRSGNVETYKYTATEDMIVGISFDRTKSHSAKYYVDYNTMQFVNDESRPVTFFTLFPRMAVIGDSLSSGEMYVNGGYSDFYGNSWLSMIARQTGAKRNHFARGGLTAKTWIDYYQTIFNNSEVADVYYIALGTNDNYLSPYPLGNITDEAGTNSFVGYYKYIIGLVKAKAPHASIMCVSLYNNQTSHNQYNTMIENISNLYDNTYYVDFIHNSAITTETEGYTSHSHFNTMGYLYVANIIYKLTQEIVSAREADFRFYGQYNMQENAMEY